MHRPHGFRNSAILLLALCIASCDRATAPWPASARLTAATSTSPTGTVGTELTPAPVVRAIDAAGRPVAGVPVGFILGEGDGEIATTLATTDAHGLASVGHWTLGRIAKAQTLTALSAGVDHLVFTATATAGPVAQIQAFGGMNQMAMQGSPLGTALRARVVDAFGNPVAGVPVTFTVTAGGGTIPPEPAVTDATGVASSGVWTLGPDSAEQQVRASSGSASAAFTAFVIQPHNELQGRLAFVSTVDGNDDIYVVNVDGTELERLTTNPWEDSQPVWTPSGDQITFFGWPNYQSGIYTMNADGSNVTRLTPDNSYTRDPAWSAGSDGLKLAYTSYGDSGADVVAMNTSTGVASVLAAGLGDDAQPSWSPDGRRLAFVSEREAPSSASDVFTMNADGTGLVRITESIGLGRHFMHPAWSPEGTLIAFVWGEYVRPLPDPTMRFHVAVMAPDGSGVRDLALAGEIRHALIDLGSLAWSPDGRGIAFSFADCDVVWTDDYDEEARLQCTTRSVRYVPLAGGEAITLIPNGHSPSWR